MFSTGNILPEALLHPGSRLVFMRFLGSLTKVNVISLLYTFTSAEFGPFSAVSTPIFASKYSFFSIFRDLQSPLSGEKKVQALFFSRKKIVFSENLAEMRKKIAKLCRDFQSRAVQRCDNLVDLEKC